MRQRIYCAQLLCVCLSLALSSAQVIGAEESRSRAGEVRKSSQERVLRGVLAIYVWKMTDAVGLTEEQAARVFPTVRKSFETRWQLAAKRRNFLELFRRSIDAAPQQESELKRLLNQWEENEAKLQVAQEEMRQTLTKILSPEQQAKSLLFEQQFEGDLVRLIAEIRREQAQRPLQNKPAMER